MSKSVLKRLAVQMGKTPFADAVRAAVEADDGDNWKLKLHMPAVVFRGMFSGRRQDETRSSVKAGRPVCVTVVQREQSPGHIVAAEGNGTWTARLESP